MKSEQENKASVEKSPAPEKGPQRRKAPVAVYLVVLFLAAFLLLLLAYLMQERTAGWPHSLAIAVTTAKEVAPLCFT